MVFYSNESTPATELDLFRHTVNKDRLAFHHIVNHKAAAFHKVMFHKAVATKKWQFKVDHRK